MEMNIFNASKNYPAMLNKIAICTFVSGIILICLLRNQVTSLDTLLRPINLTITISNIELKFINVVIAFLIALLSRMIKLHDKLSDILGIRKEYDIYKIILPLACIAGASVISDKISKITENRKTIMHNIFYKYASSTENKCKIDHHSVIMALDQWSYYWISLEINFLILLASIILFFSKAYLWSSILLLSFLLIIILQKVLYKECIKYTTNEITEITELNNSKQEIKNYLNAL